MSELSALDILGKQFGRRLRGYSPFEVHEFLSQIASAMEGLTKERGELRQRVHRLEQELADFRERESALHEALVAAQRSAESTMERAGEEAQRIVEEGQVLAERVVREAHERARKIETVIGDLRDRRREARADVMRLVELLEGLVRDDQKREHDERTTPQLAILKRRDAESSENQA